MHHQLDLSDTCKETTNTMTLRKTHFGRADNPHESELVRLAMHSRLLRFQVTLTYEHNMECSKELHRH